MALTLTAKTQLCAEVADSKKAEGIVVLDVHPFSSVADHFLICSGASDRQVRAIVDAIEEQLTQNGEKPLAGVLAREAGTAVRLVLGVYHAHHAGVAEIGETIRLDVVTHLVHRMIGG